MYIYIFRSHSTTRCFQLLQNTRQLGARIRSFQLKPLPSSVRTFYRLADGITRYSANQRIERFHYGYWNKRKDEKRAKAYESARETRSSAQCYRKSNNYSLSSLSLPPLSLFPLPLPPSLSLSLSLLACFPAK